MGTYASGWVRDILEQGPNEGEDFFRVKVTGNSESFWFNVTAEQLDKFATILEDAPDA